MKNKFEKIWDLAFPYQDKRDDKGHAEVVTNYALKLCKLENVDENIVIPAAILHDVGWSRLSKEQRFLIFNKRISKEERLKVRYKHQDEGVIIARRILQKLNYDPQYTEKILDTISEHDTRVGFKSGEEGVMRDADKLWRYSKIGFWDDIKRSEITPKDLYLKRKAEINELNYFCYESSKKIAFKELEDRKRELRKSSN